VSEVPWGARLINESGGDYIFRALSEGKASWRTLVFDGFVFDSGGIEIEGNCRGITKIVNCTFSGCGDYPIKALGASVVGGEIKHCKFSGNTGAISLNHRSCDLWTIEQNMFVRNTDTDILLGTSGVTIENNDFETRHNSGFDKPWIASQVGATSIVNNRFGAEAPSGYGPPREAIVLGPVGSRSAKPVRNVLLAHNTFFGRNGGPTATSAKHVIRANAPIVRTRIIGNVIANPYSGALIQEQYVIDEPDQAFNSYGNQFIGQSVTMERTTDTFSNGGWGFDLDRAPNWPSGVNLLDTQDLAAWTRRNVTVAQNVMAPDGTPSAFTIEKTGGYTAGICRDLSDISSNGTSAMTCGIWLRRGTMDRARIFFVQMPEMYYGPNRFNTLQLTDDWRYYQVRHPDIDTTKAYRAYLMLGAETPVDGALMGTIHAYGPIVADGYTVRSK
jgi:hypothetical protein